MEPSCAPAPGRFRFFFGFFFRGGAGGRVGQQQGGGVRRLLVNGHTHVVQHGNDGFEDFRFNQLFRQVVVDFLMGQETTGLAHLDQGLEFLTTLVGFFF